MNSKRAKSKQTEEDEASRGRARVASAGEWLTKARIAIRSGLDRNTVAKYLQMPGAPKPNEKHKWNYHDVLLFIEANAPRASAPSTEYRSLKEALLRTQVEEAAFDLGIRQGKFIEQAKLEPAISAFCTQLTADLRAKFEFELPTKYSGRNVIECRQANAEAIDWVLARLKAGAEAVGGEK